MNIMAIYWGEPERAPHSRVVHCSCGHVCLSVPHYVTARQDLRTWTLRSTSHIVHAICDMHSLGTYVVTVSDTRSHGTERREATERSGEKAREESGREPLRKGREATERSGERPRTASHHRVPWHSGSLRSRTRPTHAHHASSSQVQQPCSHL